MRLDKFDLYQINVLDYLEYIGYSEYVEIFEPADIAYSLWQSNRTCFEHGLSYRSAALCAFGLTWTMQLSRVKDNTSIVKH